MELEVIRFSSGTDSTNGILLEVDKILEREATKAVLPILGLVDAIMIGGILTPKKLSSKNYFL